MTNSFFLCFMLVTHPCQLRTQPSKRRRHSSAAKVHACAVFEPALSLIDACVLSRFLVLPLSVFCVQLDVFRCFAWLAAGA